MIAQGKTSTQLEGSFARRFTMAVAICALCGYAGEAWAADASDLTNNLVTASSGFTTMINMASYVCGTGLGFVGIFKLKQHVDNPMATALKDGMMRMGAGGALLSLPFMLTVMQGSVGGAEAANFQLTQTKITAFSENGPVVAFANTTPTIDPGVTPSAPFDTSGAAGVRD